MITIGITGTIGAGKGTIVDYLKKKYGFHHFSVRDFLICLIKNRGGVVNRDSMVLMANELRKKYHPAYIVEQLYQQAIEHECPAIIESIRAVGEIDALEKYKKFYLFAVDADSKIRYKRIVERNSVTDNVSYATFIANEQREMYTKDINKQNLSACIARAQYHFINNNNFEVLYNQIDKVMNQIQLKNG